MNRRVSTDVMSWKRRELAAPDSRAPLLLRRMACSSPANKLMRITLSALQDDNEAFVMDHGMSSLYAKAASLIWDNAQCASAHHSTRYGL